MSSSRRAPGRPPLLEEVELRARAFDVVVRRGYENVTVGDIAAEVGVSVRTLHRYFPAKADIVWGAVDSAFEALKQGFDQAGADLPLIDLIIAAVTAAFGEPDVHSVLSRQRMRLIVTIRELQSSQSEMYQLWHGQLVEIIARRLGEPEDGLRPRVLASAVQAAIMEALAFWAFQDDADTPSAVVAKALRGFELMVPVEQPPADT